MEAVNSEENTCTWFNEIPEETMEVINKTECEQICSQQEQNYNQEDNMIECLVVDEIVEKDPKNLSSNIVIQLECSLVCFIQALIDGSITKNKIKTAKSYDNDLTFEKIKSIIEYLTWISNASKILANRINQELIVNNTNSIDKPSITRSSYNFCTGYTQCKNFYNRNEIPTCQYHHYVHSLLKSDVDSIINFLDYTIQTKTDISKEELNNIILSLKTIIFVTRHMAREISYINFITKNNSEIFHRANPIEPYKKNLKNINTMRNKKKTKTKKHTSQKKYDNYKIKTNNRYSSLLDD